MVRNGRESGKQGWIKWLASVDKMEKRVEKMVSKSGENGEPDWRKW